VKLIHCEEHKEREEKPFALFVFFAVNFAQNFA